MICFYLLFLVIIGKHLSNELYGESNRLVDILMLFYCRFGADTKVDIKSILFSIIPNVVICTIFSDYIVNNLENNYSCIFTRTNRRIIWLLTQTRTCFVKFLFISLIFSIVQILYCRLLGFQIYNFSELSKVFIVLFLLNTGNNFVLILLNNVLSLLLDVKTGYLFANSCYILSVCVYYITFVLRKTPSVAIPFSQTFYVVQTRFHNAASESITFPISLTIFSAIIIFFYAILIILTGISIVKRKELY